MNDEQFEELMRDAGQTYREPPRPPLDQMWAAIEAAAFQKDGASSPTAGASAVRRLLTNRWLAIAATLVIGVAIGRASMSPGPAAPASSTAVVTRVASAGSAERSMLDGSSPYELETSKYLGQTAALLIALPAEAKAGPPDDQFIARASELLSRTRLLLDSPAASDPQMHALLDDLELVLAQIVRLQDTRGRTELDLINHALEQRDVIPRLRSAVADISAN